MADGFDAEGFANDAKAFGVEYVMFTAWHARQLPLYPSAVQQRWRGPGLNANRDMIGDMIRAVKSKGIRVMLYTHPHDGHDFISDQDKRAVGWSAGNYFPKPNFAEFDYKKWNDYQSEMYAELAKRYGNLIDGLYMDEGDNSEAGDDVVDYNRIRAAIRAVNPNLFVIQNFYFTGYLGDSAGVEYFRWAEFGDPSGKTWPARRKASIQPVITTTWWADRPADSQPDLPYSAEAMYRYTVLQASSNANGAGVAWAAGPYVGGGWEPGVVDRFKSLNGYISPVAASIKNTLSSSSYLTPDYASYNSVSWGAATKSRDNKFEYIHVMKAPSGKTLRLPAPADGKVFGSAVAMRSGRPVGLAQDSSGVSLTLSTQDNWDELDTVIRLTVANAPATPAADGRWVKCATEGGTCTTSGETYLAYGANGVYDYRRSEAATPTLACTDAANGRNPIANVAKSCYYRVADGGVTPQGFTQCANDGFYCFLPSDKQMYLVHYGSGTNVIQKIASKYTSYGVGAFRGDPAPGVVKGCFYKPIDLTAGTTYRIINRTDGLAVSGGRGPDGGAVTQELNDGRPANNWVLEQYRGAFRVVNQADGNLLNGGGGFAGAKVTTWTPNPAGKNSQSYNNLLWYLHEYDGHVRLRNVTDLKVVNGGSGVPGTGTIEWDNVYSPNLDFKLVP